MRVSIFASIQAAKGWGFGSKTMKTVKVWPDLHWTNLQDKTRQEILKCK